MPNSTTKRIVLFENFVEIVWFKKFGLKKLRKIIKKCLLFDITRWWQKCHRLNDSIWQRNRKTLVRFTTSISIRQENISIISMTFSLFTFTRKPSRFSIPIQYIYLPTVGHMKIIWLNNIMYIMVNLCLAWQHKNKLKITLS